MDGLLLVDKPVGRSSAGIVRLIRGRLQARAAGHTGTLDPRATGLLVVLLGRATKLAPYLEGLEKEYETTIRLGVITDTDDLDGEVLERRPVTAGHAEIASALARFTGTIEQRPPAYSAVQVGGERAYRRARRGQSVTLAARRVTIHALETLSSDPLRLRIVCSAGTYVRSLARDLGEALGCGGAVESLRRTRVGPFRVAGAKEDPLPADVRPAEEAVSFLPPVELGDEAAERFVCGEPVEIAGDGLVRVRGPKGFVGIGRRGAGLLRAERVLIC